MRAVASSRALRIGLARIHHRLGWASLAGVALVVVSLTLAATAWRDRQAAIETLTRVESVQLRTRNARAHAPTAMRPALAIDKLPAQSELPALLTRLEAIAVDNQLGWPAADYRLRPASDTEPASMEIRTQLTGSYPRLRRMVSQAVGHIPALTIRQLSFTRANSDTGDVEAKVVFAILLADGPTPDSTPAAHGGAP